jgi:hypothetical protein
MSEKSVQPGVQAPGDAGAGAGQSQAAVARKPELCPHLFPKGRKVVRAGWLRRRSWINRLARSPSCKRSRSTRGLGVGEYHRGAAAEGLWLGGGHLRCRLMLGQRLGAVEGSACHVEDGMRVGAAPSCAGRHPSQRSRDALCQLRTWTAHVRP